MQKAGDLRLWSLHPLKCGSGTRAEQREWTWKRKSCLASGLVTMKSVKFDACYHLCTVFSSLVFLVSVWGKFASLRKAKHVEVWFLELTGDPTKEKFGLPFRLTSDLDHISYQKEPHALCQFLRWLATQRGMGELKLEDHVIDTRFHPVLWHARRTGHHTCVFLHFQFLFMGSATAGSRR